MCNSFQFFNNRKTLYYKLITQSNSLMRWQWINGCKKLRPQTHKTARSEKLCTVQFTHLSCLPVQCTQTDKQTVRRILQVKTARRSKCYTLQLATHARSFNTSAFNFLRICFVIIISSMCSLIFVYEQTNQTLHIHLDIKYQFKHIIHDFQNNNSKWRIEMNIKYAKQSTKNS